MLDSPTKYGSYNHRLSVFPVYRMTLLVCFLLLLLLTFIRVIFYSVELLNCLRIRGQKRNEYARKKGTWLNALQRGKKNVFESKRRRKNAVQTETLAEQPLKLQQSLVTMVAMDFRLNTTTEW